MYTDYDLSALNRETFFSGLAVISFDWGSCAWDPLDCVTADKEIAGGRSGRFGGIDEEDMTVGGTTGFLPCEPCGTGKDGESTIIEIGNVAGFPVTKLEDEEAGADNGFRSYTWGAIACEASNFGDDRRWCDIGVEEGDNKSLIDIDDEFEMVIGSEGSGFPSARREGLNLEVCVRLLGGRGLISEGSWLDEGVAVDGERGGMVWM